MAAIYQPSTCLFPLANIWRVSSFHVADIFAALADNASRGRVRRGSSRRAEPDAVGTVCGCSNASDWTASKGTIRPCGWSLGSNSRACQQIINSQCCYSPVYAWNTEVVTMYLPQLKVGVNHAQRRGAR